MRNVLASMLVAAVAVVVARPDVFDQIKIGGPSYVHESIRSMWLNGEFITAVDACAWHWVETPTGHRVAFGVDERVWQSVVAPGACEDDPNRECSSDLYWLEPGQVIDVAWPRLH